MAKAVQSLLGGQMTATAFIPTPEVGGFPPALR
jgi:hypothetical protein